MGGAFRSRTRRSGSRRLHCSAYVNGSPAPTGALYQYVSEPDGSTSTYQYDQVVFKLAQSGQWRGDQSVKQRLEFFAARRRRI
jgi:hypothetical protein